MAQNLKAMCMDSKETTLLRIQRDFLYGFTDSIGVCFENVYITAYKNVNIRILGFKTNHSFTPWSVTFKIMCPDML